MPFEHYAGFVITTVILLVVPGPNVAFIVSNSLVDGGRRGFGALIGTKIALAIQLAVVVLALGKLIAAIGPLAGVLRWGGVTGLAILGLFAFRRRTRPRPGAVRPRHGSIVWQSFVLGMLNPSVFLFFTPFLQAFMEASQCVTTQLASLAGIFFILAVLIDGSYAAIAVRIRPWIDFCRAVRLNERVTGAVLLLTASILAMAGGE